MSESQTETYIFELEQALEKLLYFFEPSDEGGYQLLDEAVDVPYPDGPYNTTDDMTKALEFAEKVLYGYPEAD